MLPDELRHSDILNPSLINQLIVLSKTLWRLTEHWTEAWTPSIWQHCKKSQVQLLNRFWLPLASLNSMNRRRNLEAISALSHSNDWGKPTSLMKSVGFRKAFNHTTDEWWQEVIQVLERLMKKKGYSNKRVARILRRNFRRKDTSLLQMTDHNHFAKIWGRDSGKKKMRNCGDQNSNYTIFRS